MKYYRKEPVEAIQWTGDNQKGVYEFIERLSRGFCTQNDEDGKLTVGYLDSKQNSHIVKMPKFGWVVAEGNTLQFYKDETFRKTFKAAEEDSKGIDWDGMTDTINKAFEGFDDIFKGFHGVPKEKIQEAVDKKYNEPVWKSADKAIKKFDDFYSEQMKRLADGKSREAAESLIKRTMQMGHISRDEAVDKLCDGLEEALLGGIVSDNVMSVKIPAEKGVESDTFNSVLDEMKELHAKKNKDYGDAFHKSFVEFGPTAGVVRLNDKMELVKSLVKKGKAEVKDESLLDTLKDMSCYAVMLYVELKNKENE